MPVLDPVVVRTAQHVRVRKAMSKAMGAYLERAGLLEHFVGMDEKAWDGFVAESKRACEAAWADEEAAAGGDLG